MRTEVWICFLKTMYLSSDEVLVALEIYSRDNITVADLEKINCDVELRIQELTPSARVYLEAKKKES
jgi:divalent metal cation (Fe/Co/Zn/Cd) transporter